MGNILSWIHEFVSNHTMRVKIAGSYSHELPVTSRVSQGSVLRPMLFLLYVNYVTNDVKCPFKVFADGIKLCIDFGFDEHEEYVSECQSDIEMLVSVSSSWGQNINVNLISVK